MEFEAKLLQKNSGQLLAKQFINLQLQQCHQRQDLLVSKHTQIENPRLSAGHHLQHHKQEDSEGGGRNHQQNTIMCRLPAPHNSKSFCNCQPAETSQQQGEKNSPKQFPLGTCLAILLLFQMQTCVQALQRNNNTQNTQPQREQQFFTSAIPYFTLLKKERINSCLAGWEGGKGQGREKYTRPNYMSQ